MNAERLLAHFERVADAPDAVARLRRFILDLAVRGKLVPQDENDEPASALVKAITSERARLAKEGAISKQRAFPPVGLDETPFATPCNWQWVRIRAVTSDRGQTVPTSEFTYIDVTAINKDKGSIEEPRLTSAAEAPSRARKVVRKGDVIYSCVRPYLLKVAVVDRDFSPAPIASTAFAVLNGFGLLEARYLWLALRSPALVDCVQSRMRGQAYPAINDSDFALLPLPLPPPSEQRRIIARVDDLMAICDQLEASRAEREAKRERLTMACFGRLNTPTSDAAKFVDGARFALDILPTLTARRDQIQQLRQIILKLAVHGCLVKHGSVAATSSTAVHGATFGAGLGCNITFPSHWRVATLVQVAAAIVDCPHSTPEWTTSGKICVRTNQLRPGVLDLTASRLVSDATYIERIERLKPQADDILYSREGGVLGIACRIPANVELCLGQRMMLIRAGNDVSSAFLELVLNSPLITNIAKTKTRGGAALRVNAATVKAYPVPLPPLSEQAKIVERVNELMSLCDRLEASLSNAETTRSRLLEALLAEALAPVAHGIPATH